MQTLAHHLSWVTRTKGTLTAGEPNPTIDSHLNHLSNSPRSIHFLHSRTERFTQPGHFIHSGPLNANHGQWLPISNTSSAYPHTAAPTQTPTWISHQDFKFNMSKIEHTVCSAPNLLPLPSTPFLKLTAWESSMIPLSPLPLPPMSNPINFIT